VRSNRFYDLGSELFFSLSIEEVDVIPSELDNWGTDSVAWVPFRAPQK
jgi:hypothetical protein